MLHSAHPPSRVDCFKMVASALALAAFALLVYAIVRHGRSGLLLLAAYVVVLIVGAVAPSVNLFLP